MIKRKYLKAILPLLLLSMALIAHARSNGEPKNLIDAAVADDAGAVKRLIAQGADPNERNQHGDTALMWASARNSFKIAKLLIEKGAGVNQPDNEGSTPLMWAVQADGRETVNVLLRNGADINLRNNEGKSALDYCNDSEILRMLKQPATETGLKSR